MTTHQGKQRLSVTSEIGRLQTVLVHRPGREIDRMAPHMSDELLFDDILYGDRAREEHRRLSRLIGAVADDVLLLGDLLREVLAEADLRARVVDDIASRLGLDPELREMLSAANGDELTDHLVEGVRRAPADQRPDDFFHLPPLPNLLFQRDPAVVIGDKVMLGSMATPARLREPLLLSIVFHAHEELRGSDVVFERFEPHFGRVRSTAHPRPSIEGGDVIVVREDMILVGASIRTARRTIEELAAALRESGSSVHTVLVVELPHQRSCMHLDTVFTMISEHECLVYEPVILEGGVEQAAVYDLSVDAESKGGMVYRPKVSLLAALAEHGLDLEPVLCGGSDPITQQREQWTDGANAFALAPGVILLYERNVRTAEELSRKGYEIVGEDDILLGRAEVNLDKTRGKKYAVLLKGHELSRARGGPRCLTMPLRREPL
ncbi:MAG: hypothetical protein KC503_00050 [Myxococcales bacterium]|nr:hypothetical protein [Myxococcales bacterium]